ncbi:MAG TPA: general stress protein [Candidatus Nanoarchaeia archaeon]|nr:general stress protein [Candidatus Nanoarchaeia archaeon]
MAESKGDISVRDAGKKGGQETSRTHGKEFYQEIGKKGGQETSKTHGREFYQDIGRKGGERGGPRVRELIRRAKGED